MNGNLSAESHPLGSGVGAPIVGNRERARPIRRGTMTLAGCPTMTSPPPTSASLPSPRPYRPGTDGRNRRPRRGRRRPRRRPGDSTTRGGAHLLALALIALGVLWPGRARADRTAPHAPVRFTSLAPDGLRSEVNVELATGDIETARSNVDASGIHIDAQYVVARGAGGYGRLDGVQQTYGPPFNDRTRRLAGAEAGGFQRLRTSWGAITGRLGVSVPTTPRSEFPLAALSVVRARRPSDLAWISVVPKLRLAVTPTFVRGAWSARLDAGLDAPLDRPATEVISSYHLDLALGARAGCAAATIEYSMFGANGYGPQYRRHLATLGGQYQLKRVVVSARLGAPFTTGGRAGPPPPDLIDPLPVRLGEFVAFALGVSVAL